MEYKYEKLSFNGWVESNDAKFEKAVDILSKFVIDNYDPDEIIENPQVVEDIVNECWEDVLDADLVEAINDRHDVACITHKYCFGGGGYEADRDLEICTKYKVLSMLGK